jgi:hypothetical protein
MMFEFVLLIFLLAIAHGVALITFWRDKKFLRRRRKLFTFFGWEKVFPSVASMRSLIDVILVQALVIEIEVLSVVSSLNIAHYFHKLLFFD